MNEAVLAKEHISKLGQSIYVAIELTVTRRSCAANRTEGVKTSLPDVRSVRISNENALAI